MMNDELNNDIMISVFCLWTVGHLLVLSSPQSITKSVLILNRSFKYK